MFLTIVFDGYYLIVYGSAVPSLLAEPGWELGPAQAGAIGSYALMGMLIGALGAGALTDVAGRRRIMLAGITWFSVMMVACALATDPGLLGLFRFLAGLGLGGVIPSAIALTVEYAPRGRRQLCNALMFVGYSVGGVLAAVCALARAAEHGWRPLMAIGAAPLLIVLPLAWRFLPEPGRDGDALVQARRDGVDLNALRAELSAVASRASAGPRTLSQQGTLAATLLFGAASFCGLLLVYGLNTWLPQLMRQARASALGWALGVGRAGAIVGPLFGGWVLASGIGFEWNFYGFAVPALAGALLIGLVPRAVRRGTVTTADGITVAKEESTT